MDDAEASHHQIRAQAIVLYYSSRMEAVSLHTRDAVMPHMHSYACVDHYDNRHGGKETVAWQSSCYRRLQVSAPYPHDIIRSLTEHTEHDQRVRLLPPQDVSEDGHHCYNLLTILAAGNSGSQASGNRKVYFEGRPRWTCWRRTASLGAKRR